MKETNIINSVQSSLKSYPLWVTLCYIPANTPLVKENRIYLGVEFTRKKCKTAILLYCFHTAGVLHTITFALYNLLGPGTSFYWKSKINIKRKPNYEIGWYHNWPTIISHIDCMCFTLQTMIFRYNNESNDVFYSPNSLSKVYSQFKKLEIEMDSLGNILY